MTARWPTVLAVVWLLVVSAGMAALGAYARRAGNAGAPPARWPAESRLERAADRPTLVLVAHPRCPCTRATLGELERLLAQAGGRMRTHVLFVQPPGTAEAWGETDLWRQAARLPGVTVYRDLDGVEARRFHAATSGQGLFYSADGRLGFHGGITISRGHAGDNPGCRAILARLIGQSSEPGATAVFGCPLFAANPRQECISCPP